MDRLPNRQGYDFAEDLKIQFTFLCRVKDAVPACLIQANNHTAPAAYTLETCDFGYQSLAHSGTGVVNPNSPGSHMFMPTDEGVREGGVAQLTGALLALTSKVTLGKLVVVVALMGDTV